MKRERFQIVFQTWVDAVNYDYRERYGQVWATGPVDMSGSIRFFKQIDPKVKVICAYMEGKPDVCYRLKSDGGWEAGDLRHLRKEPAEVEP